MQPVATKAGVVRLCVCLLDTTVSRAKTDELIQTLFGLWSVMRPRNHVLGGGAWIPQGKGYFLGVPAAIRPFIQIL